MIDSAKSKQYTLSICLNTDGLSFLIYDPIHDGSFLIIEKGVNTSLSLTANLETPFHESGFLNHPYKRVSIMVTGKRFAIVPLELFEKEQAELLLYHSRQKKENEAMPYSTLRKDSVAVIFSIDKGAQTFLSE